jgi:hypothetical protein
MSILETPKDGSKALFVYGAFKPRELAFGRVEAFVIRAEPAQSRGTLWTRDGIPLLDLEANDSVPGWLLWFEDTRLDEAWSAVCSPAPAAQYRWDVRTARSVGQEIAANVLVGRKLRAGTAAEPVSMWSARKDPVFTEGLAEVRRLIAEAASSGVPSQPDTEEFWQLFFRLGSCRSAACCGPRQQPGTSPQRSPATGSPSRWSQAKSAASAPRSGSGRWYSHAGQLSPDAKACPMSPTGWDQHSKRIDRAAKDARRLITTAFAP